MVSSRTLVKDARFDAEREQAFRFVRRLIDHPMGSNLFPQSICRVLVAICDQFDDRFRNIAVETLCELCKLFLKQHCITLKLFHFLAE